MCCSSRTCAYMTRGSRPSASAPKTCSASPTVTTARSTNRSAPPCATHCSPASMETAPHDADRKETCQDAREENRAQGRGAERPRPRGIEVHDRKRLGTAHDADPGRDRRLDPADGGARDR